MLTSVPDLLRLLAVPFFAYVAWRDVKTRRVPNRTWYPLAALAVLLLAWEAISIYTGTSSPWQQRAFTIQVGLSLGIVAPLAYLFWRVGGFGGADAKAFFVIAVLFPTYPAYVLADLGLDLGIRSLPMVDTTLGVFSLTILTNTVLVGLAYPVALAAKNGLTGQFSPAMFVAKPIRTETAIEEYGSLLHFSDRSLLADLSPSGLRSYFNWRGLDLDALRMYLRWRGVSLAEVVAQPEQFRDPASLPDEPNDPGDGAIVTDGGSPAEGAGTAETADLDATEAVEDPWGAEAFLSDIESTAYGTDPATLREGLDTLVAEDVVWISPGIPFLVPLLGGLVVSLTYGDLLFAVLRWLGLG